MIGYATGYLLPLAIGALVGVVVMWYRNRDLDAEDVFEIDPQSEGENVYRKRPVNVDSGYLDTLRELRQQRREQKALRKGYIRWHLIGNRFSRPRFVDPTYEDGENIRKVEYDGVEYLFPDDALIPDAETGVYTAFHHEGRSDPVQLDPDDEYAIDANVLTEYAELTVTSSTSGLGLGPLGDLSPQQIMTYGIAAIVGYFILQEVMAGGLF